MRKIRKCAAALALAGAWSALPVTVEAADYPVVLGFYGHAGWVFEWPSAPDTCDLNVAYSGPFTLTVDGSPQAVNAMGVQRPNLKVDLVKSPYGQLTRASHAGQTWLPCGPNRLLLPGHDGVIPPTPLPTSPISLVKNPNFSMGPLSEWNNTGCLRTTLNTGGLYVGGWFGAAQAYLSQSPCTFYQDVKLPPHSTNTVKFWAGAAFSGPGSVNLSITTTNDVVLTSLYSRTSIEGFDQITERASVDLSQFAGQTVRIRGQVQNVDGLLNTLGVIGVDIETMPLPGPPPTPAPIPTMTEWAMMLLGILLAGGAALTIHQRRTA